MLPDALAEIVRNVGAAAGDSLLLDSRHGRALVSDAARVYEICLNLKRAGFTRMVDFTGMHMGGEEFTLQLVLRHPGHGHAALILKWKWSQPADYNAPRGAGQPGDEQQAGSVPISAHPSLAAIWPAAAVCEREIFEMLGVPFAGNDLDPLLLEAHFTGNPLRRDYLPQTRPRYIEAELRRRHEQGLVEALISIGGAGDSSAAGDAPVPPEAS